MYEMDTAIVAQISSCDEVRIFTLEEACALMPLVYKLTRTAHQRLEPLRRQLQSATPLVPVSEQLEQQYTQIVQDWIGKLQRLGVTASNLWVVHFDTGDGHLCWRFPELRLANYHFYDDCEHGRRSLSEYIELYHPDWA